MWLESSWSAVLMWNVLVTINATFSCADWHLSARSASNNFGAEWKFFLLLWRTWSDWISFTNTIRWMRSVGSRGDSLLLDVTLRLTKVGIELTWFVNFGLCVFLTYGSNNWGLISNDLVCLDDFLNHLWLFFLSLCKLIQELRDKWERIPLGLRRHLSEADWLSSYIVSSSAVVARFFTWKT